MKRVSAERRTISLFTHRTDLEYKNARDSSLPEYRSPTRLKDLGSWVWNARSESWLHSRNGRQLRKLGSAYRVSGPGIRTRDFDSMIDAAQYGEK